MITYWLPRFLADLAFELNAEAFNDGITEFRYHRGEGMAFAEAQKRGREVEAHSLAVFTVMLKHGFTYAPAAETYVSEATNELLQDPVWATRFEPSNTPHVMGG